MDLLSGPVLLCSFFMSSIVYWHVLAAVDYLLHVYMPVLYERLEREDHLHRLNPLLLMIVRVTFGLTVSFPACVQAARTTPWGVDQPLNTSGQVCVVSQLAVWSNELPMTRYYSFELFIHHMLCLFATANIAISPPIHQIKPLYIYFASLVGDIGPGSVTMLKTVGLQPSTSRLMFYVSAASTSILVFCRVGCAFYTVAHVLTDPYNPADWAWVFSVLLFGFYSLSVAFRNLKWIGIINIDPVRRFRITYFCRFMVPVSHSILAAACGTTLLSTLFAYGLYLDRPLRPWEIGFLSINGLVTAAIGLTGAIIARIAVPSHASSSDPWGNRYLQFGVLLAGTWAFYVTMLTGSVDRETVLAALGINAPLFLAIARVAHYYSAKDAATAVHDEKVQLDEAPAKRHLDVARENAVIFLVSLVLLVLKAVTFQEAARLAVASCAVIQQTTNPAILPLAVAESHGSLGVAFAIILSVSEPGVVVRAMAEGYIKSEASAADMIRNYVLLGGATATAAASKFAVRSKAARTDSSKTRGHPVAPVFVFVCIVQVVLVLKLFWFGAEPREVSVGFKNFQAVLSDPVTWVGVLHVCSLPVVVMSVVS